jgi:hypothetical protein
LAPLSANHEGRCALERLTQHGMQEQWCLSRVDWSLSIVAPPGVRARAYVDMISQLYHLEKATIEVLGRLAQDTTEPAVQRYLTTHIADETRHARAYRAYLERLGDMAPINEGLRILFDVGLGAESSFRSKVAALNVMLETDALGQQRWQIETLPCPLLRQINHLVAEDETRHILFGGLYMKHALLDASESDKQDIVRFGASLFRLWQTAQLERYEKSEAALLGTRAADFQERWSRIRRRFAEIGLLPGSDASVIAAPRGGRAPGVLHA